MDYLAEEMTRAILLLTKENIESYLAAANTRMAANDAAWYAAMDKPVLDTPLDSPKSYHENLLPDINPLALDQFPTVAVLTFQSSSAQDTADTTEEALYDPVIEAFVSSRDVDEAARIVNRYANALLAILEDNPTLNGLTAPLAHQPTIITSSAVMRRESTTTDRMIYLQGCRIELTYRVDGVWKIR